MPTISSIGKSGPSEAVDSLSLVKWCHHHRAAPDKPTEFQRARSEWQYQRRGEAEG
ncbi:hypothetical protein QN224_00930 [Sinorhizobium sp. 8-89]|uniref:hypothetical protein n=1 Tax=Sinorhizobium sp. 7-81 TaxID=3049087 RepID=UPI0024C218A8|nr:hypothetical protein [Sinorhizobium sp. 7-81]MDK1383968.1 hypothetical protein [Sinorhizobium sp. 7-81]